MWRTFDVRAVLASLPVEGNHVVAGAEGLGRRVRRALLAARPDDLRRVDAFELIVTTVETILAVDEDWEGLIARLDAAQVAGLAVRLSRSDALPRSLLDAADRTPMPIIAFGEATALADMTASLLDAILDAQSRRLERVLDIDERFTRILAGGGGVAEIASTLHTLLEVPVAVIDAEGRPIVVVPSDVAVPLDSTVDAGRRRAMRAGDHDYGHVVALPADSGGTLDEDGRFALERAAMTITVRMAQASAVAEAQERFAAISLEELVAGDAGDAADVAERANSFGWDLARPRAVLLASIDPPVDARRSAVLGTIAAAARATLGSDAIIWTRSATVAALIAPESDAPADRRRIAERLRHELDRRVRTVTVSIGVGRRVDDPSRLQRSFDEAGHAVEVGRWAKGRHVTEVYDELGLERLLASTPADDLAEFVEHTIGALVVHDREHGTELLETLGVWLETRNMAAASRRIHVHYNTFKNRLERIESILGPVLTDPTKSLECAVAIHVARHYDGPWSDPPRRM